MNKKFSIFRITMLIGSFFLSCMSLYGASLTQNITVTIKNETSRPFIVKLVNTDSNQAQSIQVIAPQAKGQDTIKMLIPSEQHVINIIDPSTNKEITSAFPSENLRLNLSSLKSSCISAIIKPRPRGTDSFVKLMTLQSCT